MDTSVRILRVFVTRWLDRAEYDTDRTLRKLVEFGSYFSGSVPQKRFFAAVKSILTEKNSQYYMLARTLFSNVSKDRITEFGIAFGYYGLAKNARFSNERHFQHENSGLVAGIIPPLGEAHENISLTEAFRELAQSGTSVFFIFCDEADINESELFEIVSKNPRRAFFVFTSDDVLAMKYSQKNVMPVLNLDLENQASLAAKLKKRGRLFGGYCRVSDENADNVTSEAFLDNTYKNDCLFLFLIQDTHASGSSGGLGEFTYREKRRPSHPIFITKLPGDIDWLNELPVKKAKQ